MFLNKVTLGLVILILGTGVQSSWAQRVELHPYAGGLFSGDWKDSYQLDRDGVYGLKAAVFVSNHVQLEGNLGYVNHFKFKRTDPKTRAWIWEVAPSFNFFNTRFSDVVPFVSVGAGGVTGIVGDPEDFDEDFFDKDVADFTPENGPPLQLQGRDTFFQFSYGGGVKAMNLWGPVGLRGEVRGRTIPNFFGNSITWLETTGGVTFTWGER
jgi:hypothetical protein